MIEIGTLLQNRYLIEKQIGAGGMGAVYLAVDRRFDSHVAIKETFYKHDELGEAFEREARLLNSLLHPGLPHVSDYFTENNGHFLVMQYIEGDDLFEILKRDGAFPVADVMRWLDSLLDALDYLHSREPPVIHRDIKPQNLKITPRGVIILLDFGLAKLNSVDTTGVKSVFGYSRKYSPLEQIQGTGTDARSDIFSLGATAYHLLTGEPPIDVLARAASIIAGNPDPLQSASEIKDEIPSSISEVLRTSLALNAAGRFVSAQAMRAAVENAVKKDLPEVAEKLPEPIIAVAAPVDGAVISVENEDFPALASFAADIQGSAPTGEINIETTPDSAPEAKIPVFEPAVSPLPVVAGNETRIRRSNKSWLMVGVLTAVLVGGCLAAWFSINEKNSTGDSLQTVEQTASMPEAANGESTDVPVSDAPEISDTLPLKNIEKADDAPAKIKTPIENPKAVEDKISTSPETKAVPNKPRPNTVEQTPRRSENRNRTAPASEVEAVFTGRSRDEEEKLRSGERRPRWQQRREREEMSEEEFEEMRRIRRERRRQRRNTRPFPY